VKVLCNHKSRNAWPDAFDVGSVFFPGSWMQDWHGSSALKKKMYGFDIEIGLLQRLTLCSIDQSLVRQGIFFDGLITRQDPRTSVAKA
jgi:hypothetical protein